MGVQFLRLDAPSREVLNQMLARKAAAAARAPSARRMPAAARATHRQRRQRHRAPPRVDTSVDLAAEFGVDEAPPAARASTATGWGPGARRGEIDELEALLKPEPVEPGELAQALAELPRLLDPSARRRMTRRLSRAEHRARRQADET